MSAVCIRLMTKFQLISDLHLDFYSQDVDLILDHITSVQDQESVDVLIIAGDLAEVRHDVWLNSIKHLADHYESVFMVLGNHEHYRSNRIDICKACAQLPDNVILLDNNSVMIGDHKVAGGTLWFDAESIDTYLKKSFSDFICIPGLDKWIVEDHNSCKDYLLSSGADLIITHHAPHPSSIHPSYHGNKLNPFFCTDCTDIIDHVQPQYWVHGHTHHAFDYMVNTTRVLANPLAYPMERYWSPKQYPLEIFTLS